MGPPSSGPITPFRGGRVTGGPSTVGRVVVTASPRLPELEQPDLSISEREALAEFWGVYEEHFDEVTDAVEEDARGHPELAAFVGGTAGRSERREQIRSAIVDDDWGGYQARI